MSKKIQNVNNDDLFQDLSVLIGQIRNQTTSVANRALTLLFWKVVNGSVMKSSIMDGLRTGSKS